MWVALLRWPLIVSKGPLLMLMFTRHLLVQTRNMVSIISVLGESNSPFQWATENSCDSANVLFQSWLLCPSLLTSPCSEGFKSSNDSVSSSNRNYFSLCFVLNDSFAIKMTQTSWATGKGSREFCLWRSSFVPSALQFMLEGISVESLRSKVIPAALLQLG